MKLIKTILGFLFNQLKLISPLFLQSSNLKKVFNYYQVPGLFETSGQPNNKQLISIANGGYEVVINLAPNTTIEGRVINEKDILKSNNITYIHIPVDFNNPLDEDFNKFVAALEQNKHKKIWVHCAANMRVSAFVFKYRRDILGLSPKNIEEDLEAIWVPNKTWSSFLEKNS
jgi:protein tyrosine phosphatase (PTP) superfamily phosphohydrolase (DUF442 family)